LHPRKRRNTERGPEAGVRGASPGVWVRRTGGGMYHLLLQFLLKVLIFMRRNQGAEENGAEDVLGFLNTAIKDLATHACPHACP